MSRPDSKPGKPGGGRPGGGRPDNPPGTVGWGGGTVTDGQGNPVGVGGRPGVPGEGAGGGGGGGCIVLNYGVAPPPGYTFTSLVHDSTTGAQGDRPKKKYCPTNSTAPPPAMPDLVYDTPPSATMPDVKTGIIADQYAKLLDVPYRQAFMPGGPEDSIFAAANVMPPETKADPRPYSRTKQIPIRDLYKMKMRDATDAELLKLETGPDKPFMSKDDYEMMTYQLDYMEAKKPKKKPIGGGGQPIKLPPGPGVGKPNPVPFPIPPNIMPPYPGPITGPIIPLPVVGPTPITPRPGQPISIMPKPPSGGVFTPSPGGGGGGTYTGPGVNLPGPVIPLPVVGGPPKTGGNLIPLSNELGFTIDNEGNKIYSDAEGNRVGMMDGGMTIISDGVANDGIGGILKKYKEIRSEL